MESERWQRIQRIFDDAVERPAPERAGFVEEAAAGDAALAREVLALLAAWEDDPDYLERNDVLVGGLRRAPAAPEGIGTTGDDALVGARIGPWSIGARLGEGGMGVVYRAERADGAFEQTVAIKVVRRGLDTEHLLQRFRSERRILAALDHPDIARPVDAGVVPDGRPYLAMEYVQGERIDAHCQRQGLDLRARLDLFLSVCDAVDHAHRRLVIHRDLKPANILVTPEGRVKLLDFGVAKLLDPEDPTAASTLTSAELRPLTPDYASPEQLRGDAVTTASDVYSLGVLLFELLTGRRPFDRASRPVTEWTTQTLAEAARPSIVTAVVPAMELAGDLDAVVLTALHPDPPRRYDSPRALAEDLRRHRAGLPVRAREDSTLYRVQRFVRRHRLGVGVAAAFVAMVLVSGFLLVRQVDRTQRERERAERERAAAEQVVQLLIDLFETNNPTVVPEGDSMPIGAFLDRAARNVERLADQPDVQVRAWVALAGIHTARSRLAAADSVLARADALAVTLPAEEDALRREVALAQGRLWAQQGRVGEARARLTGLVDALRSTAEDPRTLTAAMLDLAIVSERSRKVELLEEVLARSEKTAQTRPTLLASALNALANENYERGDYESARTRYEQAEAIMKVAVDPDHPDLSTIRHNLAALRSVTGDFAGAERSYRELLASRERVLGPRASAVAGAHSGLAIALAQQGRHAEAQQHFVQSASLLEELLGDAHPRVALEWHNLARSLELQRQWEAALDAHERAAETYDRSEGAEVDVRAWYLCAEIPALIHLGRIDDARVTADRAFALEDTAVDGDERRHADVLLAVARTKTAPQERKELLERCLALRSSTYPGGDPRVSEAACALGVHLAEAGELEGAQTLLDAHFSAFAEWPLAFEDDVREARETMSALDGARR